jgi:hypothetical protein
VNRTGLNVLLVLEPPQFSSEVVSTSGLSSAFLPALKENVRPIKDKTERTLPLRSTLLMIDGFAYFVRTFGIKYQLPFLEAQNAFLVPLQGQFQSYLLKWHRLSLRKACTLNGTTSRASC